MQFYTKCAVLKTLCAVLKKDLCILHCISIKRDSSYSRLRDAYAGGGQGGRIEGGWQ